MNSPISLASRDLLERNSLPPLLITDEERSRVSTLLFRSIHLHPYPCHACPGHVRQWTIALQHNVQILVYSARERKLH